MAHSGDQDFLARRALAAKNARDKAPKSAVQIQQTFMKNSLEQPRIGYFTDGPRLRAKSTRHKNRTVVVGGSPFVFDADGITSNVIDQGRARADYDQLLRMNGITAVAEPTKALESDNGVPAPVAKVVKVVEPPAPVKAAPVPPPPVVQAPAPLASAPTMFDDDGPPDLVVGAIRFDSSEGEDEVTQKTKRRFPNKSKK